jgi:S1-C subfamily serine protease
MLPRPILPVIAGVLLAAFPATAHAKGFLGVQYRLNPDGKGMLIMEVLPDSAAAKAGIKAKDVVLKVDGTEPTSLQEFRAIFELKQPGDEVTLDILHDGKEKKVKVILGKMGG